MSAAPTMRPPLRMPPVPKPSGGQTLPRQTRTFAITQSNPQNYGEKILIYAASGFGKTSLAVMAPDPVFMDFDRGSRRFLHPKTGAKTRLIEDTKKTKKEEEEGTGPFKTFDDWRDALHQATTLVPEKGTLVIDTVTTAIPLVMADILTRFKTEKGATALTIDAYGYGKGYLLLQNQFRLILADLNALTLTGRNVLLLAQERSDPVPNPAGEDFGQAGPRLMSQKDQYLRPELVEWCDHVLRIAPLDLKVESDGKRLGKATGGTEWAIFTQGASYFVAKSRPINGKRLPLAISFVSYDDDSLWQMIFNKQIPA